MHISDREKIPLSYDIDGKYKLSNKTAMVIINMSELGKMNLDLSYDFLTDISTVCCSDYLSLDDAPNPLAYPDTLNLSPFLYGEMEERNSQSTLSAAPAGK